MQDHHAPLLLSHYKAYHTLEETAAQIEKLIDQQKDSNVQLCVALPYTFIAPISEHFAGQKVIFGAEHMLSINENTFPASIAVKMIKEAGAKFVMVGSRDERKNLATDESELHHKIVKALNAGIAPIICITDTEEECLSGSSKATLSTQLNAALSDLTPAQLHGLYVLYDAAWITRSPWHESDTALQNAYKNFNEALAETLPSETIQHLKVMYGVPTYSIDLAQIIKTHPAKGYFLGTLVATTDIHTQPLPHFEGDQESPFEEIPVQKEEIEEPVQAEIESVAAQELNDHLTSQEAAPEPVDEDLPAPTIWEDVPPPKPKKSKTSRRVAPLTDIVADQEFQQDKKDQG